MAISLPWLPSPETMAPLAAGRLPHLFPMVSHCRAADAIAQVRKADSNRLSRLRQQASSGHPWIRIDFKALWVSGVVQPEIDSTVGTCLHSTMSREGERAHDTGRLRR